MSPSALLAALRIARRSARRSRARSALILAMIGTPVMGLAAADVLARTAQLPRSEITQREMGAADLLVHKVTEGPVRQPNLFEWGNQGSDVTPEPVDPTQSPAGVAGLPPASRAVRYVYAGGPGVQVPGGQERTQLQLLDARDPMAAGMYRNLRGRWPAAADEVAVSSHLARIASVHPGDRLTVTRPDRVVRVVGVADDPDELKGSFVFALPESRLDEAARKRAGWFEYGTRWLVDLPDGADQLAAMSALNQDGWFVRPRVWMLDPPPVLGSGGVEPRTVGVAVVVVGLATLEVMLLAGTAFAVGVRRQRRELALVAATGGDRRHVRAVVLASGLVLGVAGGVLGVVAGGLLAMAGRPMLGRLTSTMPGPWDIRPLELLAVAVIGAVTGVASALWPAVSASRQDVVAALTGRHGAPRRRRHVPVFALVAVAAGAGLAWYGAGVGRPLAGASVPGDVAVLSESVRAADFRFVLTGAVMAELGFIALAPAVIGALARFARRFPLTLRLATRDAARHRSRSGPAVAAVCAAVAGSVALSVWVSSDMERQRRQYEPSLPAGAVELSVYGGQLDDELLAAVVHTVDPVAFARVVAVEPTCTKAGDCTMYSVDVPAPHRCPLLDLGPGAVPADFTKHKRDSRCLRQPDTRLEVGDSAMLRVLLGRADPSAVAVLDAGGAVVFDERLVSGGRAQVLAEGSGVSPRRVRRELRAVFVPAPQINRVPGAFVSSATADRLGLQRTSQGLVLRPRDAFTEADRRALVATLSSFDADVGLYVERGFNVDADLPVLALLGGSLLVTMLATGIATGLASVDSRPDLATLAAVGAAPRLRRTFAVAQALSVSGVGSILGLFAGLVPAVAVVSAREDQPLVISWWVVAATVVAVPLVASLPVGVFVRSRLPMVRRLT